MFSINDFDHKKNDSQIIDSGMTLDTRTIENSIKLFNLFLSSNSNYLYNKTYILDLIDKFIGSLNTLRLINKISIELSKELSLLKGTWFALVDDYFIITYYFKNKVFSYNELSSKINEIPEESNSLIDIINKFVNCNNLYNINKNDHTVRFFCNDLDRLFSFSLKEVSLKNENKYDFSNLIKQITSFIEESEKGDLKC